MKRYSLLVIAGLLLGLSSCQEASKGKQWVLNDKIVLPGINPIGLAASSEGYWLSDGDRNRLVLTDRRGKVQRTISAIDRPMHISATEDEIFVPQYTKDQVFKSSGMRLELIDIPLPLDAPAGVGVYDEEIAIADFFNHRIVYYDGIEWNSFGTEGKEDSEFYYPTDVQITANRIWVADTYNNRVQVFDKNMKLLKVIGADAGISVASGLFVTEKQIFVTDFENNRVLAFDHQGNLVQIIDQGIEKPIDALVDGDQLIVSNYGRGELVLYR